MSTQSANDTDQKLGCVCDTDEKVVFFEARGVPVHCNVLWPTREAALSAPKGDIRLAFWPACGHIFNIAFDPGLVTYTEAYENSLHFSPRFQQFAEGLADRLIARYDLRGRDVIDVGCGKGDWLKLLVTRGGNRGIGFDRSYDPTLESETLPAGLSFVQDFFSEQYAHLPADLLTCRHVLEHIEQPLAFVAGIRRAVRPGTLVYFEVPNALYTLRDMGIWDIIYEHCSYFSAASLSYVFLREGFDVLAVDEAYGGQFLGIEARPSSEPRVLSPVPPNDLTEMAEVVVGFGRRYTEKVAFWKARLEDLAARGKKVVAWGAGSKGVTFLNTLQAGQVDCIVDINPRKHGRFVAGTGQVIVGPEALQARRPDVVLVMNPLYVEEIRQMLAGFGLDPELQIV